MTNKFYAEIFESERYVGTRTISVHQFETETECENFIQDYNTKHLNYDGFVPKVYTMAERASWYAVQDYKRSLLQDETFSK